MRCAFAIVFLAACQAPAAPRVSGAWWQIAAVPDLGALQDPTEQPVDFAIWQAADGTWQLQSCIRMTREVGMTRLFYRWQAQHLTDTDWTPVGIAMRADTSVGETAGGLQAPYVLRVAGVYHLFYGDWQHIAHATSSDGKDFTRVLGAGGQSAVFSEGLDTNTRDPMVLPVGDRFLVYYTAFVGGVGADYVRSTTDLASFDASTVVAAGGAAGSGIYSAECPFVAHVGGDYFLFRTQRYGMDAQTSVYRSPSPTSFGLDDDRRLVGTLPLAAPELVEDGGQWYIASLLPSLAGIRLARLEWTP